ncbi:MAG: molybdopterin biosynthesis protein [Lachnospiraceae bacterium]|nr:molybdopterin biosynthesis protein [Lachnospiraceae bacterium]
MKYEYLSNTPLEEAREKFLNSLKEAGTAYKTEVIRTRDAAGRVLARAHYARRSSPHYLSSAMDGIAISSKLIESANESSPAILKQSDFIMVDTGDPLPEGTDCVVMIEQVVENGDGTISLYSSAAPWSNVRQIGEDVSMGDMIAPSFARITPSLVGALLAGGVLDVEVVKIPSVALIPTGDEIVDSDSDLKEGDIPEYNSAIFSGMLAEWGAKGVVYPIVRDDPKLIKEVVSSAAKDHDAIIVIAGSSAGRDDYTSSVLAELGELVIHGIAIKPGKPAILGHIGPVPFFGVPGYPVSGIIVMEKIVRYALSMLTMIPAAEPEEVEVTVTRKAPSSLKYEEYIRCQAAQANGKIVAVPMSRGAGIVTGFSKASGMITVPQNCEGLEAGASIKMQPFRKLSDIENTLCVTGSHDPLIDEVADILIRSSGNINPVLISSSHVGSMGAITAVRNNEAHLGGIHLLDTETGIYNLSYIRKYFPNGGAVLIRGVIREQGLMITKGNPKGISGIKDLPGLSYVNRQKGAGTRILLDYLIEKEGITPDQIYGYTKEEYTHTAVAAAIASGTADCGMGIYSAAKTYDLDFLHLWDEQYDFLVAESAADDPRVLKFIEVLRSEEFRTRLEKMGGYVLKDTGDTVVI